MSRGEAVAHRLHTAVVRWNWPLVVVAGVAIPAGWLAYWAGLPAAWLIGPMLVSLALALIWSVRPKIPRRLYTAAQAVIGTALTASFDPQAFTALTQDWLAVMGTVAVLLTLSLLSGLTLARLTRLDLATAVMGTTPGGAPGMVAMSDELGAETPLVAFMQYLRVVLVALTASLLARFVLGATDNTTTLLVSGPVMDQTGQPVPDPQRLAYLRVAGIATLGAWAGLRFGLPAGAVVGPLLLGIILSALGMAPGRWPPGVLLAANALIGLSVGGRFDRAVIRQVGRLLPIVLGLTLLLMAEGALLGLALMRVTGLDLLSAYLATTPGGIDAVMIAALDTGANIAVILPIQVLRVLVIMLAGPFLVRWLGRKSRRVEERPKPGQEINLCNKQSPH